MNTNFKDIGSTRLRIIELQRQTLLPFSSLIIFSERVSISIIIFLHICPPITRKRSMRYTSSLKSYQPSRACARAVYLGGPSVYQEGPTFEIKHKSHFLQKRKLVNWGGQAPLSAGPAAICLPHQDGAIPLSAFPKGTTSKLAGLLSTLSL